ncbi:ferrous iron transport protein A [Clostridium acetobutylicum]|uniref:FeoA protein, involved in Fe2+ transport n=1 Tax=Clostridium acetobutylicum (strain ATCC 824 / DSM 792 / JCM 1419 / IAM 19013 / LMG 5710 / NBRC 13948 / NRRL B-527 / VKM B-1787 / 2291 / W) TaxID=272562 RepID=Q97LV7_CLOAB|nr:MULTISPECIES: ferrous iron transport protein A [Clostridium]AAK78427.1 FeoA protein, involved in Fe2+ transport [Clostridium acetobutylicum ATCC 824]ADZ19497.1 FeoA protein [Clostridium acetobutylicum EA 2018]AEI31248.1 FeoA protein, involved in Fe2+ transport [Clostridium acetobutylicum DSM 1731]AWV80149.1 ferrous iron transport protein A [Clostridium acetobutylicum]KHD37778.1 iron transporter FeoA [Clostridium acetobutylicum]
MSLYDLKPNEKGRIKDIKGDERLSKRLSALGFIEGTEVEVKMMAPLGDPILVNVRGFNIAIRKNDAKNIFLKEAK